MKDATPGRVRRIAISCVLLLIAVRAVCELSMMRAHGSDAQMGLWQALMAANLLTRFAIGLALAAALGAVWRQRPLAMFVFGLLLVWAGSTGLSSARYYSGGAALRDASAPSTSPERLRELVDFDGFQAGYELDNRIASNPNAPPDTLRLLYNRPNQIGTDMCLARNPNTPDEILIELARREGNWSQQLAESLKRNPKYDDLFGGGD